MPKGFNLRCPAGKDCSGVTAGERAEHFGPGRPSSCYQWQRERPKTYCGESVRIGSDGRFQDVFAVGKEDYRCLLTHQQ